jgi:hypothetical protein
MMAVTVRAVGPNFEAGVPAALFQAPGNDYTVSPDGQRFLFNTSGQDPTVTPITIVLNWPAGLNKK